MYSQTHEPAPQGYLNGFLTEFLLDGSMAHQTQNTAGKTAFIGWLPWVLDILCTFENTSSRTKNWVQMLILHWREHKPDDKDKFLTLFEGDQIKCLLVLKGIYGNNILMQTLVY